MPRLTVIRLTPLTPLPALLLLLICLIANLATPESHTQLLAGEHPADVLSIAPDLTKPPITTGEPAPGKHVLAALPNYEKTKIRHSVYLPTDWQHDKTYPVIFEYAGNGGTVKGAGSCQGFGISGGKGFIWVCLPYVSEDGQNDMNWWWGDPDATATYALAAIDQVCKTWHGNPKALILTGYSRGAIACNYIGLRNDEIASKWLAMVPASHYDNLKWGQTPEEQARQPERLKRLGSIPQYVCAEHKVPRQYKKKFKAGKLKYDSFEAMKKTLKMNPLNEDEGIRTFINQHHPAANVTYDDFPWPNHTVDWILRDTPQRQRLRAWVHKQVKSVQ